MWDKVIVGVLSGALGFFVGWGIRTRKANKEINDIYAQVSKELSDMKRELESYHTLFISSATDPDQAGEREKLWKQVSEDIKKGRKKLAEEKSAPSESKNDESSGLAYRREEEITDYRAIMTKNKYACDLPEEQKGIIRKSASNGIIEIEEYEAREFMASESGWEEADLYYYEMSSDVYDDQENMLDEAEIPLYLGYNAEELAIRFLHNDEPQYIYVKNPDHRKIYCVYCCQGVGPE